MKISNNKIFLFGLVSCLLLQQVVFAQSDSERVIFRTIGWNTALNGLYFLNEGNYQPLKVEQSALSGFNQYRGGSKMALYRMRVDPETGSEVYYVDSEVALPNSAQFLLVFFGNSKNQTTYRAVAFNDSIEVIGNKDILIANFSPVPLAFQLKNSERFGLKPAESRIIKGKSKRHVDIQLAAYRVDSWKPEYSTKLRVREGRRYLLFFKDTNDPLRGSQTMEPIIVSENLKVLEMAMASKDPNHPTGYVGGGIDTFDFSNSDVEFMPELPKE